MGRALLFILTSLAFAKPPHLELELTSRELETLLLKSRRWTTPEHVLDPVIASGKSYLDWLKLINQNRPPAQQINLSSAATQPAYPIEAPRLSNPTLILTSFEDFKKSAPDWLNKVLFQGGALTQTPPVSDEEFKEWGLKIDPIYARASRWLLQEPYLKEYAELEKLDVRGLYFLGRTPELEAKLRNWNMLSEPDKNTLQQYLLGLCYNKPNTSKDDCSRNFEKAVTQNAVHDFYALYHSYGQKLWNDFFEIPVVRNDVKFTSNLLTVSEFLDPNSAEVRSFLKDNIEEEWRWNDWQLNLSFVSVGKHPKIVFVPGATANVNELAGEIITMDANKPLTEYDMKWTIRHEYGHVLGFPDCYVEFFDTHTHTMVSYQLDITNLMCSRRGHLQQTHFDQMIKAYKNESRP